MLDCQKYGLGQFKTEELHKSTATDSQKKEKKSKQKKTHYYESSSERQDWNKFKTLQLSEPSSSFEPRQSLSLFATLAHFMLCKYLMSQGFLLRTSVKN